MPVIRTPSVHSLRSNFLPGHDESPSFLRIFFSSCGDGLNSSDYDYRHYEDPHASLSQWIGSSPLLSDLDVYEPGSQCPPSLIAHPTNDDQYYSSSYDEPLHGNAFTWQYDSASSSSGFPSLMSESGVPVTAMSPSISIISSSPRSDSGVQSPPLHEFSNVFDFDYGTSPRNEFQTGCSSWSSAHPPSTSASPSPSCSSLDGLDLKPSISRDPSPATSDGEKLDRRRFPCLILGCTRRFTSQYTLKVHMEAHKPKPRVTFPCTEGCSERFSRQHDRLRHEVAKHGKVCEFLCDECGRFFSTKKTLGNHKCPVALGGTRWVTS